MYLAIFLSLLLNFTLQASVQTYLPSRIQHLDVCYAHTVLELVDYYAHKKHFTPSPLYTAIIASNTPVRAQLPPNKKVLPFEYGNVCRSLTQIQKHGFKSYQELDEKFTQIFGERESQRTAFFEWLQAFELKAVDQLKQRLASLGIAISKTKLEGLLTKDKTFVSFLFDVFNLLSPATQKPSVLQSLKCKSYGLLSKNSLFLAIRKRQIINYLSKKEIPVGIDFCESYLMKGLRGRQAPDLCLRHATTLIDVRFNNKSDNYEVLIKNTTPCTDIHPSFNCQEGNKIWASLDELIESAFEFQVIVQK